MVDYRYKDKWVVGASKYSLTLQFDAVTYCPKTSTPDTSDGKNWG